MRNEVVQYCTATVSGECGTEITEICDDADLCDAYNFNNLAYEKAEPAFLTDGKNQTDTHASIDVTIPITLAPNGATVELWPRDLKLAKFPFSLFSNGSTTCDALIEVIPNRYDFDWNNGPISSIRIQRAVSGLMLTEATVFNRLDTTRTVGVFQK